MNLRSWDRLYAGDDKENIMSLIYAVSEQAIIDYKLCCKTMILDGAMSEHFEQLRPHQMWKDKEMLEDFFRSDFFKKSCLYNIDSVLYELRKKVLETCGIRNVD